MQKRPTWEKKSFRLPNKYSGKCNYHIYTVNTGLYPTTNEYKFPLVAISTAAKSFQSCSTLCNPIDGSPPSSPVRGILQARTLEWVAISFSSEWKWKVQIKLFSCIWLLATPWTAAYRLLHPWDFPGKSTGVGCHCLLPLLPNSDLHWRKLGKPLDHPGMT